jgi:hypothetical protein
VADPRQGLVTELQGPAEGKKMGKAKVGNRVVRFFWNEYETTNPSQVRQRLEKAALESFPVVVTGEEMPNPTGSGPPMFKALQVERASQSSENGSHAVSQPSTATGEKHFVGRDPGMADFWLATRWAWSLAAEVLAKTGKEPSVGSIAQLAGAAERVLRKVFGKGVRTVGRSS